MKTALTISILLMSHLLQGQTTGLKLASDVWTPFTDVKPKKAFALDLVHEALGRAKVQSQTDILDFKEVIAEIRSGRYDGSAALWRSPEREEFLLYSEPYLENRLVLVGKKGSNVSAVALSELPGKRIAIVQSYAYGPLLNQGKNMKLVAGKSDQQNLERLLKGEVDYMLVDALLIEYLLKYQSTEAARHLEIGKTAMIRLPLYFAIRKDIPGADTLVRKFNEEIRKMIAEGTYNRILQLNWIAADMDGDGQTELVLSGDKAGLNEPAESYMVSQEGQTAKVTNHYFIEGKRYQSWDQVPEKYKVLQTPVSDTEKIGFGPVLNF